MTASRGNQSVLFDFLGPGLRVLSGYDLRVTKIADAARRAERAHYRLQSALYLAERQELAGATLFASPGISEPEWNHAGLVDLDPAALPARLADVRCFFAARGLPATVVVSPWSRPSDLAARLAGAGFAPSYRHAWLFAPPRLNEPPPDVTVAVAGERDMDAFVEVFEAVYEVGAEAGYGRALRASFRRASVTHYLAYAGSRPAAVASTICAGGACGLYNLAVLPEYRRRGLGTALTHRRLADARGRGATLVFLQTERREVERWQRRNGLTHGFETVGWTAGG